MCSGNWIISSFSVNQTFTLNTEFGAENHMVGYRNARNVIPSLHKDSNNHFSLITRCTRASFYWGNSCLVLDAQWCHNSTTQRYHIGGQVNNKEVLWVPGLSLAKVMISTTFTQVILSANIWKSTPNGTNVTNQLFLEGSLFCSIVTSEHLLQISFLNFLT